ncbi:phage tail protein [Microbacterium sp. NPDC055903]
MSEPYLGEVRIFAGNFAPVGWAFCDGSLLRITQYEALYTLLGVTYGGDGVNTFALPDLRGRYALGAGQSQGQVYVQGQSAGVEDVTLTRLQIPVHSHAAMAAGSATSTSPDGGMWAVQAATAFADGAPSVDLADDALGSSGGNQPHQNMPPYVAINHIIALEGVFPPQN